jgi:phosphoglycolate phosphatase-like HAD superfamily hydrolase
MIQRNVTPITLNKYEVIIWDFDGVIKDSVIAKGECYTELFRDSTDIIRRRIAKHHSLNGGISRFEKIPLYLQYAGKNQSLTKQYINKFHEIVVAKVLSSDTVSGVDTYIRERKNSGLLNFIASATPLEELKSILTSMDMLNQFQNLYGSEVPKSMAVKCILEDFSAYSSFLFIGDATSDLEAANSNQLDFVFRGSSECFTKLCAVTNLKGIANIEGYFEYL